MTVELEQIVRFQEQQLELLRRERAAAMDALDLASALGSFAPSLTQHQDQKPVLREMCARIGSMVGLQAAAVYLAQDEPYDFLLTLCEPEDQIPRIEGYVNTLINDNSFAFALNSPEPHYFLTDDKTQHLLLHVIGSPTRVHGMFVGLLNQSKDDILDTTNRLFSVVMLSAAHALESFELNKLFKDDNRRLESKILRRTQDLQEANAKLSLILDSIQAGVLLIDGQTQIITEANPAALSMLMTTREELLGKPCYGTICFEPDEYCPFHAKGASTVNAERTIHTMAQTTIPIIENVKEITIQGKRYLLKSFTDISEQKKLQQLREDVERITRHDLKGPLNGIINLPDVIQSMGPLSETQVEMLQHIKDSGFMMLKQINLSLDLFKMETGAYEYSPTQIDILPIVQTALLNLRSLFKALNITASVTVDGAPIDDNMSVLLDGEESLLLSLLSNLVTNAAEASPRGHHVSVHILQFRDATRIEIHNFGVVPESIRDNFFGKYVTSGKKGGTGLGTYSAKLIADTMHARIDFTTNEKAGTTVSVTFRTNKPVLSQGTV